MALPPLNSPLNPARVRAYFPGCEFRHYGSAQIRPEARLIKASNTPREDRYLAGIRDLSQRIQQLWPDRSVQTAIQAMAGTKACLTAQLFPQARLLVHLDDHPLLPRFPGPAGEDVITYGPSFDVRTRDLAYRNVSVVSCDLIASGLLTSLWKGAPQTRFHELTVFFGQALGPAVHGWIDFDSGAGTPRRQLLHLNVHVPQVLEEFDSERTPWMRFLGDLRPQAAIFEAAMGMARPANLHPHFRTALEGWLVGARGFVVEGADPDRPSPLPGASLAEELERIPFEYSGVLEAPETGALVLYGIDYGYLSTVRISVR